MSESDGNGFKLQTKKVLKALAIAHLHKSPFYLSELIERLRENIESIGVPSSTLMEADPSKNLFEGLTEFDLSFIIGQAVIIPKDQIKLVMDKKDHAIRSLHPYFAPELDGCGSSAEKRLEALFALKEKWTKSELESYLTPFIDLTVKFDTYLMKNTRMIKEANPFDPSKETAYYIKKF